MVLTTSASTVLTSPGAVAERGWIALKCLECPTSQFSLLLEGEFGWGGGGHASSEILKQQLNDEVAR